jgi:hypothetical protein
VRNMVGAGSRLPASGEVTSLALGLTSLAGSVAREMNERAAGMVYAIAPQKCSQRRWRKAYKKQMKKGMPPESPGGTARFKLEC